MILHTYNINFMNFFRLILPVALRKSNLIKAYGDAFMFAIAYICNLLFSYKYTINTRLQYSPQVCRMRAMLNDLYDNENRRITVSTNPIDGYIEIAVPERYYNSQFYTNQIKSSIELYKLAGTRYRLTIINS